MQGRTNSKRGLTVLVSLMVGAVVLLAIWYSIGSSREEAGYWPLLIFALCPLMHLLMPGSHGGHGAHRDQ